jgi:hypothetical protein
MSLQMLPLHVYFSRDSVISCKCTKKMKEEKKKAVRWRRKRQNIYC